MKTLIVAITAFTVGIVFSACATPIFPYNYYAVDLPEQKLLGPASGAYGDQELAICEPNTVSKAPCIGMLTPDFLQLKQKYLDLEQQVIDLQKQLAACK